MATNGVLRAESLDAGYGAHLVVKGASVEVAPGAIVCLLGPNGAGKSTLLKALVGIVRCSAGRVLLGDLDVTNERTEVLAGRGLAYVPQLDDVFAPLTVLENLEMGGYLLGRAALRQRIAATLDEFPTLAPLARRRAATLSGGERKLLAVARALMIESRFLLLDEPTAALSPTTATSLVAELVQACRAKGTGMLIVEQRARAALEVADEGHILVGGRVRTTAPAFELLARADLGDLLIGAAEVTSSPPPGPRTPPAGTARPPAGTAPSVAGNDTDVMATG
jgi:ABC-type branched-subunit amino acid transport system ATPase component